MAVPLPYVSSIAQAKEYASAAMSASASVCPAAYDRYKECYASAATYEQQQIAGTPFEGDAVRRLVDMLDSANGFCHDVRTTGSSSPPARTVTGNEPDPMPTTVPAMPTGGSYIPPSPGGGTTYKPASVAAGVTGAMPWWVWGGLAVLGVWFWKKSKKKGGGATKTKTKSKTAKRKRRRRR